MPAQGNALGLEMIESISPERAHQLRKIWQAARGRFPPLLRT